MRIHRYIHGTSEKQFRKTSPLRFALFAHLYCLEDYTREKTGNSKQSVRMHSTATSNKRLCEPSYNEAQKCRTLRSTFHICTVIETSELDLETKVTRRASERTKERRRE